MKVIFLDIDGVLNTSETFYKRANFGYLLDIAIDEFRLEYLKEILEHTQAKIVLSSLCKCYFKRENDRIVPSERRGEGIYSLFYHYGIEIFDITPNNNLSKEEQIKEWLSLNNVENFIIIDDDPNSFCELKDNLIQTSVSSKNYLLHKLDNSIGLCREHVCYSIDMLNKKEKQMVLSK